MTSKSYSTNYTTQSHCILCYTTPYYTVDYLLIPYYPGWWHRGVRDSVEHIIWENHQAPHRLVHRHVRRNVHVRGMLLS